MDTVHAYKVNVLLNTQQAIWIFFRTLLLMILVVTVIVPKLNQRRSAPHL